MTTVSSFSTRSRPLNPLASSPEWVHARFERAVDIIQSLPKSGPIQTNYEDKLSLYASYKQATEGDIKTSRPGLLDVLGRAKWDAWNKRKGLTQMQAERAYVEALIRILKGYADRTQAVELLKELENFSLDPRGGRTGAAVAGHGSIAPSRTESSHSSDSDSSSTASYDDRRSITPPPLPSSSRHQHHHHQQHSTRSSRTLAPPAAASPSASGARSRPSHLQTLPPPPPSPAPADAVAPPLPGYGPPRTQPDAIRHSPRRTHRHRRRRSREYSSSSSSSGSGTRSGSESETESEEEDTRNYHPAASHRSFTPAPPPQAQQTLPPASQRGPPSLPPHPSQLASHALRPPPPLQMPSSLRSVAGSERSGPGGGGVGQGQQVAVAYPVGYAPSLQQQRVAAAVAPLTSANLRTAVLPPTPISASTPALPATVPAPAQRPELDAALQRIQTSLTALHERLSLLESTPEPSSAASTGLTSASSPLTLLREILRRLFILLRLRSSNPTRSSSSPPAPSSPSLAFRTPSRPPTPSFLALLWRLSSSLVRTARRTVSDALVVFAVVVILGRMRGVDVMRVVGGWVVRYAAGVGAGGGRRARVEGV